MTRTLMLLVAMVALAAAAAPRAQGVTDEQVRKAIEKGVDFLYKSQDADGSWESYVKGNHAEKQYAGMTSLVCYGLLSAGEDWQGNPKLMNALKFLGNLTSATISDAGEEKGTENRKFMYGTYAVGFRSHVWAKLPKRSMELVFAEKHLEDQYALEAGVSKGGNYRYTLPSSNWDNSVTQYGVLGMWECAKRGIPVPNGYWTAVKNHFLSVQSRDSGGWSYTNAANRGGNLQMTAAGLACMYIVLDYLHSQDFSRPGIGDRHPVIKSINHGLEYMDKAFKPSTNGYNMVGVERVGLASGMKYFGGKDWYQAGAEAFIKSQAGGGSFSKGGFHGSNDVANTAFALVFLSRGRVPVFANKLIVEGQAWNNRPRDLANVARWASDEFEIAMNWQVIGLERQPEEWLDAPILYLASHQALDLTEAQIMKIKRYIDLGGTLVTADDGGGRGFTNWVRSTFESVYDHKFRNVDPEDDIYNIVFKLRDQNAMTLHNGVRHLVIHLPRDPGVAWQTHAHRDEGPWQLMGNIFQYAIEKSRPRNRLERHYITKSGGGGTTVHVGRASYDGNWQPEPLAWERADVFASNDGKAGFVTHDFELADIGGQDVSLVHVAGTEAVDFTADQVAAIKQFVTQDKGVILFEAAGGGAAFTESVRQMLLQAFADPDQRLRLVGSTSRVLTGAGIGGYDATRIDYRVFFKQRLGATSRPGLLAITIDGEPRIFVSPEDLSNGMLHQPVWGVFGYDSESATHLATNVALHAASLKPATGAVEDQQGDGDADDDQAAATQNPDATLAAR